MTLLSVEDIAALSALVAGFWTVIMYLQQRKAELAQQRRNEDDRRVERVGMLLSEFNKVNDNDIKKKIWTVLELSLYPNETVKLLSMALGHFDEDTSRSVILALVGIGDTSYDRSN